MVCKTVTLTEENGNGDNGENGENGDETIVNRKNILIAGVALAGLGLAARK